MHRVTRNGIDYPANVAPWISPAVARLKSIRGEATTTVNPQVVKLNKELTDWTAEVKSLFDKEDDFRKTDDSFTMPKEDRERVIQLNKQIEEKEVTLRDLLKMEGIKDKTTDLLGRLRGTGMGTPALPGQSGSGSTGGNQVEKKSFSPGQTFFESKDYQQWLKDNGPSLRSGNGRVGQSPAFGYEGAEAKALIWSGSTVMTSTTIGAYDPRGPRPMEAPMLPYIGPNRLPFDILSLITHGTTDSDTVEYVIENSDWTNNAAPVAEAQNSTFPAAGVSGTKPESALGTLSKATTTVKTLAHWIPVTKRVLSDAGQMATYIDQFLRWGLMEKLETLVLSGDGTGENFLGILNQSGITVRAFTTDILTTARKARTDARIVGRVIPEVYIMNPLDWEAIDLLQDNEGRYFYGGPSQVGVPRLWGLPVVETERMAAGNGLTGSLRTAVLWDREQANIQASDSHQDFFVRNLVAILCEMRAAFTVFRPREIVKWATA